MTDLFKMATNLSFFRRVLKGYTYRYFTRKEIKTLLSEKIENSRITKCLKFDIFLLFLIIQHNLFRSNY
jgi:hypothetical protein